MINVNSKRCGKEGCSTQPSLGAAGSRKAEFCATHAQAGMINVNSKRCGKEACSTLPSFGAAGSRKAEFCATHARAGMVNVNSKRCGKEGCSTRSSFGAAGSREKEFCATHARTGMVNVNKRRRGKEGCSTWPSFGSAGSKKAEFCATHARAGMVNVNSKRCAKEGCSTYPSFGSAGSKKAVFCAAHARAGMVIVDGDNCASQHHSTLVQEHGNTYRGGAHDLIIRSDPMTHIRKKCPASDDFITIETGVGFGDGCEQSDHSPNAGPNMNDDGRTSDFRCNPRVIRDRRRGAHFTTTSPAPPRQPPSAAAADRATIGGAEMRKKIKMEDAVAPARSFEWIHRSIRVAAGPSSYDSMGLSGSSRTLGSRSCTTSITNGRNTKRIRRTAQVLSLLHVAARDNVISEDDGTDVKLELNMSSPSRHVSAVSSRLRKRWTE